ncbi:MAG: hypothetical protein ACLFQM_07610 [Fidelibacterota bacterium]
MKKISLILLAVFLVSGLNAQVFNTGNTLSKGKFSATGAPVFGDGETMLIGKIGYGIKYGTDMAVTMGFGDVSYLGVDFEKVLGLEDLDNLVMSFSGGVHHSGGFGLDGTLNLTVPLDRSLHLYSGIDLDLILTDGSGVPIYLFIGAEYTMKRKLTLIGEVDLGINDAGNMLGIGLCYYFNGIQIK